jgi:hypothetical protein
MPGGSGTRLEPHGGMGDLQPWQIHRGGARVSGIFVFSKGAIMRSRYEDTADDGLDEPVTITERQLRSLKRGARIGLFAMFLAIIATGLAGWNSLRATGLVGTKPDVSSATEQPASAEGDTAQAAATSPGGTSADSARSSAAGAPATEPVVAVAQTPKPVPAATRAARPGTTVARAPKPAPVTAAARKPVTESFAPSAATTAPTPTPSPVPVAAEQQKPAAQDSSAKSP